MIDELCFYTSAILPTLPQKLTKVGYWEGDMLYNTTKEMQSAFRDNINDTSVLNILRLHWYYRDNIDLTLSAAPNSNRLIISSSPSIKNMPKDLFDFSETGNYKELYQNLFIASTNHDTKKAVLDVLEEIVLPIKHKIVRMFLLVDIFFSAALMGGITLLERVSVFRSMADIADVILIDPYDIMIYHELVTYLLNLLEDTSTMSAYNKYDSGISHIYKVYRDMLDDVSVFSNEYLFVYLICLRLILNWQSMDIKQGISEFAAVMDEVV